MGKPYAKELFGLSDTYAWALATPIEPLVAAVSASSPLPLLAVGSGGSFSAAHLACSLHQYHTGMVSKAVTPLELVLSPICLRSLSTMVLSAGGSNPDIVSALENIISREPRRCTVLCFRKGSAVSRLAKSHRFVEIPEFQPPSVKDGFLATNALLAFAVLLVRAYGQAFCSSESLPRDFDTLLGNGQADHDYLEDLLAQYDSLGDRETLLVLYGPSVASAAFDLESKFSEAALGNVQLADFRNFAHGRHNWLAKRGSRTGVLAICAKDERDLCDKTLRLIPQTIPVTKICVSRVGPTASVAALIPVLHLVGAAGRRLGIDPGKPGVPTFGRRIYNLRALRRLTKPASREHIAIARKLGCDVQELQDRQDLAFWQGAYHQFVDRLVKAAFGAVLLDYDGTVCDDQDRFSGPCEDVGQELTRLLQKGIALGVATGRGDSARADLRKVLPKQFWGNVLVGYYNGSDIGLLSDDFHPISSGSPCDLLKSIADALATHPIVSRLAQCKVGQNQISVRPSLSGGELVWRLVQQMAHVHGLAVVRSSHSIDVLRPGLSKRSLSNHIRSLLHEGSEVLSIGDRGQWPGNDFDLLNTPYSLSVDDVSADPETCWNIAPAGCRGVQALLEYLRCLQLREKGFQLTLPVASRLP
ncbi:MAG: sucrose-6-phosphate hydrolase [Acidobacteria bacterium]|nr:sucrose-6-phosphate hydrolase [Acidobacteriota bacterium]